MTKTERIKETKRILAMLESMSQTQSEMIEVADLIKDYVKKLASYTESINDSYKTEWKLRQEIKKLKGI